MKKLFIIVILFISGCGPVYQSDCLDRAVYAALIVSQHTNQSVRLVESQNPDTKRYHIQAQTRRNGRWRYLRLDGNIAYESDAHYPWSENIFTIWTMQRLWQSGLIRESK